MADDSSDYSAEDELARKASVDRQLRYSEAANRPKILDIGNLDVVSNLISEYTEYGKTQTDYYSEYRRSPMDFLSKCLLNLQWPYWATKKAPEGFNVEENQVENIPGMKELRELSSPYRSTLLRVENILHTEKLIEELNNPYRSTDNRFSEQERRRLGLVSKVLAESVPNVLNERFYPVLYEYETGAISTGQMFAQAKAILIEDLSILKKGYQALKKSNKMSEKDDYDLRLLRQNVNNLLWGPGGINITATSNLVRIRDFAPPHEIAGTQKRTRTSSPTLRD